MTADRVQLGWSVPRSEWERFTEYVRDKWSIEDPYRGFELELGAREFLDADEYAPVEALGDRLVEAAGRSRSTEQEKNLPRPAPSADTTKVWVRVHEGIRADLARWAAEHDAQKHEVLRAVIRERLDGGRARRTEDKLASVVDTAEGLLAEVNPGTEDGLTHKEKVTLSIAGQLGEQFSEEDLAREIDAKTTGSDYYHERYAPLVVEHKSVRRWEKADAPDVFLTPEIWVAKMTTEICRNLGGTDDSPPPPFTRGEFAQAAKAAGLEVTPENKETVNDYKDRVLSRHGFSYNSETERFEPADGGTPDPSADQAPRDGGTDAEDGTEDVDARMDALMAAEPEVATDGGREP